MKRLILCGIIIILFLTSAACTGNQNSAHDGTPIPSITADVSSQPDSPSEKPSEEHGMRIGSYFDGEVYISLSNQSCDLFEDYMFVSPSFFIISKEEIGKSNIKIELPISTPYTFEVKDETQRFRTIERLYDEEDAEDVGDVTEADFEFEHFLMLQDADWRELARIRNEEVEFAEWIWDRYGEVTEKTELDAETLEKEKKIDENNMIMEAYYEAFDEFNENDIPEYYIYSVKIRIPEQYSDETADHVDIKLGEKAVRLNFGEWRFHSKTPDELKSDNYGIRQEQIALLSIGGSAYDDGYALLPDALSFTVGRDDITVNGVDVFGSDIKILGAHVRLESSGGDQISDYYWDMKMPLDFVSGQKVSIDVIVYSDKLREYEIFDTVYLKMLYDVNGNKHSMLTPCYVRRLNDPIETYLLAFEGKDFYDYHQFYLPAWYGPSLPDFPDSWRK